MMNTKNRLSKILAAAGVASRRACEELIFAGRVKVNEAIVKLPQTLVDPAVDQISVDGKSITGAEPKAYYILNKPTGYLCSSLRHGSAKIILDLFEGLDLRLFTIGRLDKATEGLLLVTNDGQYANQVMHPSSNIEKEYLVKSNQEITHDHLAAINAGTLVEGVFVKPTKVSKVRKGTVKIAIMEGKKHEVRLLMEAAGLNVLQLTRIRIGNLHLGTLAVGAWREMTEREKQLVFE